MCCISRSALSGSHVHRVEPQNRPGHRRGRLVTREMRDGARCSAIALHRIEARARCSFFWPIASPRSRISCAIRALSAAYLHAVDPHPPTHPPVR